MVPLGAGDVSPRADPREQHRPPRRGPVLVDMLVILTVVPRVLFISAVVSIATLGLGAIAVVRHLLPLMVVNKDQEPLVFLQSLPASVVAVHLGSALADPLHRAD